MARALPHYPVLYKPKSQHCTHASPQECSILLVQNLAPLWDDHISPYLNLQEDVQPWPSRNFVAMYTSMLLRLHCQAS